MDWKSLISPVRKMTADEAKKFIEGKSAEEYQLLDVRQPKEYEAEHLPGALLIPLSDLSARMGELDKEKTVIAYCAVGGRSRAAAQLLSGNDFKEVFNMSGGIKAWNGLKATGPEEEGLEIFTGNEEFGDAVSLAYTMEDGLQGFYQTLALDASTDELKDLFKRLATVEGKHKARLADEYRTSDEGGFEEDIPLDIPAGIMEGGGMVFEFLEKVKPYLDSPADVLQLAMTLETQAYDLYGRMARKSTKDSTKALFVKLVDEEKGHLAMLSQELDKIL